jgi:Ca2+-binding EF-hand superfamily protein
METTMNTRWIKVTALGSVLGLAGLTFSALSAAQAKEGDGKAPDPHHRPGRAAFAEHWFERMDANKDGQLSRQEAETGTLRLFDRLDANKDGTLTKAEAETGAPALRKEELSARFGALDTNKDARLSADESKIPPRFFEKLDSNHDGALTLEEFLAQPDFGEGRREFVFDQADHNHDGKVTRAEAEQSSKERFDRLDANHDGVVTREEFAQHLQKMAAEHREHHDGADTPSK